MALFLKTHILMLKNKSGHECHILYFRINEIIVVARAAFTPALSSEKKYKVDHFLLDSIDHR